MSERASFSDDETTAEHPTPDDPIKSALTRIENIDDDSNMGVDNFDQFSTQTQKTLKSDSDDSDSGMG